MSTYADTLISSKKTNRLNRSPVRQNPTIAARKIRAIASNRWSSTWMTSTHIMSAATPSTATNRARPAPNGSGAKSMPTAAPARGVQPPNHTTTSPPRALASVAAPSTAIATAASTPTIPATRGRETGDVAASTVAASTGTRTASGATDTAGSAAQGAERVGVAGAEALVRLHGQREEDGRHRRLDGDVGQRQPLHERVDDRRARRDVGEDRRLAAVAPPDGEQEHVGRGLHHADAQDEVDEVAARHHAVEADQQQPDRDEVREHGSVPPAQHHLVDELAQDQRHRRRDLDADGDAQHRHGAARQQRARRPERQEVVHRRHAEDQSGDGDQRVRGRAHGVGDLHERDRTHPLDGGDLARGVDEQQRPGEDDATLEAAAGRQRAVDDDVDAEQEHRPDQQRAERAQRRGRLGPAALLGLGGALDRLLAAVRAQEHGGPEGGDEEDQLLTERVEPTQVERHAGHRVRDLALVEHDLRGEGRVRAARVAVGRQPAHAPDEQRRQPRERDEPDDEPRAPTHGSPSDEPPSARSSVRIFARVSSTITGTATPATTIGDSPTSGAPKAKKSTASATPRTAEDTAWRSGSRVRTTAVPATATAIRQTACSAVTRAPPGAGGSRAPWRASARGRRQQGTRW